MPIAGRALLLLIAGTAACERAPAPAKKQPIDARPAPVPVEADVMLVIDMSKSMEETDLPRDRLDAAQGAARRFLAASPRGQIGLVIFALEAKLVAAPTTDRDALDDQIEELRLGDVPELGTAIGDGLALAVEQLSKRTGRRAVVLMADGESNVARRYDPAQAADFAKGAGVTVYTILVGDPAQTAAWGGVAADPATLRTIAATTGGAFYEARSVGAFDLALVDIRARLDARP